MFPVFRGGPREDPRDPGEDPVGDPGRPLGTLQGD